MKIMADNREKMLRLRERIETREARVGIVGLGYTGLPLAIEFATAGFDTVGLDVDGARVAAVNAGDSAVPSVPSEALRAAIDSRWLRAETDPEVIGSLDCVIVSVPTPLSPNRAPDTRFVEDAMRSIAGRLRRGALVVLQSTTYPGCTRGLVRPVLELGGLEAGEDFHLAYAPERIDPGNSRHHLNNTPRLVGGLTPACAEVARALYQQVIESVMVVESLEVAEMAKLVENSFRFINISFVNELAVLCDRLGINVWQVIDAAATKPFAFMPHYPGPGIGGDCIPTVPFFLEWRANQEGMAAEMILVANRINDEMPPFVVEKLERLLAQRGRAMEGARVLVAGVSYKPNLAEMRGAPSVRILQELLSKGANVRYHDPLIPALRVGETELRSSDLADPEEYDAVLLVTPHRAIDYTALVSRSALILDTQNALGKMGAPNVVSL